MKNLNLNDETFVMFIQSFQQMAVRCWCLKFHQTDHQFLHESHVFSNISRILSKSEEAREENNTENVQVCVMHMYSIYFYVNMYIICIVVHLFCVL